MSIKAIAIVAAASLATAANADNLLNIDLSVVNQITITADSGLSAASVSGSTFTGVLMADFYSGAGSALVSTLVSGDVTSANNPADNSPLLFRGGAGTDVGLNLWSFSTDITSSFTAGTVAFSGSGTWTVDAAAYADMLAGASGGDIYAFADTDDDIPFATVIGQYNVVPAPGSAALLGLGGLVATRRRR